MTSQFPGPLSGKMLLMKCYTLSLVKHILVLDDLIFSAAFISSFTFLTSSQAIEHSHSYRVTLTIFVSKSAAFLRAGRSKEIQVRAHQVLLIEQNRRAQSPEQVSVVQSIQLGRAATVTRHNSLEAPLELATALVNVRKGDSGGRQEVAEIRAAREVTMQIGTPPLQGCFFLGWSRHLKELQRVANAV